MVFDARFYPDDWDKRRQERLKAAGYRCEECGVAQRTIRQNLRTGEDYIVYLSLAHKKQYQTWMKDAETMMICQRCHRRFDRQFRRKGRARTYTPISHVDVYARAEDGRQVLAGEARTYDELRDIVAAMPPETAFSVHMVMHQAIVGNGEYVAGGPGRPVVVGCEYGACVGLSAQMVPLAVVRLQHLENQKKGTRTR